MDTNSKEARESLGGNEAEDVLRRYALLKKISLALGSSLVPEELFRTIAAEIMKAVPYNRCLIAYVNPHSTGYIYWHVESDVGIPERKSGEYRDPGTWLFKNVYETKTPVYIPDILASGVHWLKMLGDAGLRSSAFIPILQDGECTAHLALSSLSRDAYSKRQLDLLVDVASLIGPAIRNASLYQEARIRASHLEISGEIAKAVGSELEPDELFKTICQEIRKAIPFDRIVFGKYLHANEGYNFYHEEADELIGIPSASEIERGLMTEEMYRTKKPHFIPDLLESPWSESRNAKAGYRAILAVPIIQDGVCYAHLRLASKKPGAFTKEHEDLLVLVASHMGPAIRNAELYQESEERGKRLAALNQFNQKIIKNLNLFEVLESTVGAAMVLLKAEHSRIFLLDETSETLALRATHGRIPGPPEEGLAFRMGEGVIGKLAKRGEAVILPDVQEEPGWVTAEWVREADVHSYIAAPLRQSGKVIGVINCFSREKNFFSEEDLDFLNTLATQATVAIQNARLFEEVQERTAELESARDEAEKVNTAKGEFIANLSHELRSPLNAVLGFSDLLLMLVKDEKIVDIAGKIRGAGKHLMRMIEDLLDLDRIETGKFRLDFQETAINGLVEEMVKSRREQLPENFTLKTKIDSKCGTVVCDPVRIIQILTNLLDNAVKYSPEGGTIWVRTQAAPGEVQITVEDEGLGMTPDEINVIFERFSQLESGMNRRAGGLGLGLSIVKKMLELHDGRILVKSTKGVGSAFSFVLPMIAVKHPSARKKPGGRTGSGSGKTRPEPWSGKNILVVDDLEHNHEYVKILMESARKIVSAYNGKEGIEAARRERPDLIFMDLRMPVLDGFEAIKRLKSDSETRDIPVLAVTAQAMDEDRERCLALGADGFITKPIDLEIFQKKIEEALSIQLAPGQ